MRHQGRTVTPQHLSVVLQGGLQNAADSHAVDAVVARFASVHHLLPTSADVTVMIRVRRRSVSLTYFFPYRPVSRLAVTCLSISLFTRGCCRFLFSVSS